jgi:hypothetical protein
MPSLRCRAENSKSASPTEESAWLIERLAGHVYCCEAPARGRASCDAEIATGSVEDRSKR